MKEESTQDPVQVKLKMLIKEGFLQHKSNLDMELHEFWQVRDKLSMVDDIIPEDPYSTDDMEAGASGSACSSSGPEAHIPTS